MAKDRQRIVPLEAETTREISRIFGLLRAERLARGWPISRVAESLEIAKSRVSHLERGMNVDGDPSNPALSLLVDWTRLFGWEVGLVVVRPDRPPPVPITPTSQSKEQRPRRTPGRKPLTKKAYAAILAARGRETAFALAKRFGVTRYTIRKIWDGESQDEPGKTGA